MLVPLAVLAFRRRWAAFVLGGTVAVLALVTLPELFTRFSDLVSLSQSRRLAGFVPLAFAFVGGLALLVRRRILLVAALAAGIVLERLYPGSFSYGLGGGGGPGLVTWVALVGGALAIVVGATIRRPPVDERWALAAVAAALFVLPVAVHGFAHWSPRAVRDPNALPPRIVRELKAVPARAVIIAPLEMSYRILAAAPVYVVAAPPAHVADTSKNRPYLRRKALLHWLATHDPAVPRRYGATWEVTQGHLRRLNVG